ncbi:MAG: hypothetical protein WCJ51_01255 [Candidatus Moraniibacteriota bacterium]
MATEINYACDNCDFVVRIFHRLRHETMLRDEGPSTYFCINCKKEARIFSDEEKRCPNCGKDKLIGCNVTKCPKCQIGNLIEDDSSMVNF